MSDVKTIFGVCEADQCRRGERVITSENEKVTIGEKKYHKGCEPAAEEQEAARNSNT